MSTALDPETAAVKNTVGLNRSRFIRSTVGRFATVMMEAMREYLKMREAGVSREDAVKGIEACLRESWPIRRQPRHEPCVGCDDTGWRLKTCDRNVRCERLRCGYAEPEWEHTYVVPCDCAKGDPFRQRHQESTPDALASVGRTKKPRAKGWTRVGQ